MILCLDVGNSHLFGGLIDDSADLKNSTAIKFRFRHQTRVESTSDQLGVFIKNVLNENGFAGEPITSIGISSVVPGINYSLRSACIKYFSIEPFFLKVGVKTGLEIKITNIGSDMVATAIAAAQGFPKRNIIVIDLGTATTYTVINDQQQLVGQVIQAGIKISMQALQTKTANLPAVPITKTTAATGINHISAIQSGLYYSQLGAMREISQQLIRENFNQSQTPPIIIATGGFAHLFSDEKLFDELLPDLVFYGLNLALNFNQS